MEALSLHTPLLDTVQYPKDIRAFSEEQLKILAKELRDETVNSVAGTGGHLGAGLGVVELTVALHYLFDTPKDKILWDVGHQAYPHKILTGRRERMHTIRQKDGLSGFTKRKESEFDPFGAGHSSTSISAALGMAVARDMQGGDNEVIAVIGDGAMSAGMAYEAMNNAGALDTRLIVILNDNDMSIAPPTGAMSAYLARLVSSKSYRSIRDIGKAVAARFPEPLAKVARRAEHYARGIATGNTLFEEMGLYYVGPVDGHNLDHLLPVLRNIKEEKNSGPVLLHVVTHKGYGYPPAEESADKYHGVAKFDIRTGAQQKSTPKAPSYTNVFADALCKQAAQDPRIVGISAAMPSGTGMDKFAKAYPDRCFDVGIAEQHAVTFAAGLAAEGMRPFAAIYSTFLQRAYDQIVHDVAIQNLPVRFAIDRAGLVGADGQTHAGSFDITYLATLPNMVVMASSDEAELTRMVVTAQQYDEGPIAFRYPRGEGIGIAIPEDPQPLEIGKGWIIQEGTDLAILSLGGRLQEVMKAVDALEAAGFSVTVADARFVKPLDTDLISRLAQEHPALLTVEEGAIGGFGSHVLHYLGHAGYLDGKLKVRTLMLPDYFQDQAKPDEMYEEAGLNASGIVEAASGLLRATSHRNAEHVLKV